MKLIAICEALNKNLAGKVYQKLDNLQKLHNDLQGTQEDLKLDDLIYYVKKSDISDNVPHGDYILKVFENCINKMLAEIQAKPEDTYIELVDTLGAIRDNCSYYVKKFVRHKPRLAKNGKSTNINDYAPKGLDGTFDLVEKVLQEVGEELSSDVNTRGLPGVDLKLTAVDQDNPSITYRVYQVTNPDSLSDIAMGFVGGDPVGWCTKGLDMANAYLKNNDMFVVFRNNQPISQFNINITGALMNNPFASHGEIGEFKDSQNEDEKRKEIINLAKQTYAQWRREKESKYKETIPVTNRTLKTVSGIINTIGFNYSYRSSSADLEGVVLSHLKKFRDVYADKKFDGFDKFFLKHFNEHFADFATNMVGAYDLGLTDDNARGNVERDHVAMEWACLHMLEPLDNLLQQGLVYEKHLVDLIKSIPAYQEIYEGDLKHVARNKYRWLYFAGMMRQAIKESIKPGVTWPEP